MKREYYSDSIANFLSSSPDEILGKLALGNEFALEQTQRNAWVEEINILREVLMAHPRGTVYFEYSIPRMGQRIDAVLLIGSVIFVLEFKIGEKDFTAHAIDQVFDYALDLKNFHETSHERFIAPVLIATEAKDAQPFVAVTPQKPRVSDSFTQCIDLWIGSLCGFLGPWSTVPKRRDQALPTRLQPGRPV